MGDTGAIPAEAEILVVAVGRRKVEVIEAVREITGLRLRQVVDLVDRAPFAIRVPASSVNDVGRWLVTSGAIIEIGPVAPPAPPSGDRFDDLERLGRLHRDGVLSDAEFTAAKQRVLDTI